MLSARAIPPRGRMCRFLDWKSAALASLEMIEVGRADARLRRAGRMLRNCMVNRNGLLLYDDMGIQ